MFDIAKAMQNAGLGPSQEFPEGRHQRHRSDLRFAPQAKSLEGYLFPNTYEFTRTQSMHDMAADGERISPGVGTDRPDSQRAGN